jgi:mono/diheme cytochrome c family protein/uncharacterized membrane protein
MSPSPESARGRDVAFVVLAGLALATGAWLLAPGTADADVDGDAEQGRELFATHCAACHGRDARGSGGTPDLTDATDRLGVAEVATTIREGRGGMPAFGQRLEDAEIQDLVAHLEQLAGADADIDTGVEADDRGRTGMPMMHGRWRDGPGGWPLGVGLVWLAVVLVVVVLVVAGIAWIVRSASSSPPPSSASAAASSPAREILDHRYARGELSREDYLRMRDDLDDGG